jgi:hypothetical protein
MRELHVSGVKAQAAAVRAAMDRMQVASERGECVTAVRIVNSTARRPWSARSAGRFSRRVKALRSCRATWSARAARPQRPRERRVRTPQRARAPNDDDVPDASSCPRCRSTQVGLGATTRVPICHLCFTREWARMVRVEVARFAAVLDRITREAA